ncbi:NADH dehydrogenase subunit M [Yersinia enterocolitica]|nr:NADH dehydrogenase subunit M [Yersinia enterocolitica]
MMQRAYYGAPKSEEALPGMSARELSIILLLVVLLVLLGVYPQPILDTSHAAMSNVQQWFSASSIPVPSITTTRP